MTDQDGKGFSAINRPVSHWALGAVIVAAFSCLSGGATEFNVVNTTDTTNVSSLRGAIIAANAAGGVNTIILTQPIYLLTLSGADEDAAQTGDLDVTNGYLTIIGAGNSNVVISATNLGDRVFQVMSNAQLTLVNLTITGGVAPGGVYGTLLPGESGGAIYNSGTLIAENCVFVGNASGLGNIALGDASGNGPGDGGAIYITGFAYLTGCAISGNNAGDGADSPPGNGGGVFNSGTCLLSDCLINNNRGGAVYGGGSGGGGIYNVGEMVASSCNILSNVCLSGVDGGIGYGVMGDFGLPGGSGGSGGGIFNLGNLTLDDCTFSMNVTGNGGNGHPGYVGGSGGNGGNGGNGGGLCNAGGSVNMTQCTIGGNSCGNGGTADQGFPSPDAGIVGAWGGSGGSGAGIYNSGEVELVACTIANNTGGAGGAGADGHAGGFYFFEFNTNNGIVSTNIVGRVFAGAGGVGGNGGTGGIFNSASNTSIVTLRNVLVAKNVGMPGGAGGHGQDTNLVVYPMPPGTDGSSDLMGSFVSFGYNLAGVAVGSNGLSNSLHDLSGIAQHPLDPLLGPLADNGNNIPTYDLCFGSPAIDRGDESLLFSPYSLDVDERGASRGFGVSVDIGAVEYNGLNNGIIQSPLLIPTIVLGGSEFQISFIAAAGQSYNLLVSTNLSDWSSLGFVSESTLGFYLFQDGPFPSTANRFYRVVLH